MSKKIKDLIQEGEIQKENNFEDFNTWKMKVQFFVEQKGSAKMVEEVEKELKKKAIWVDYIGSPKGFTDSAFRVHHESQLKNLISILEAMKQTKIAKKKKKVIKSKKRNFLSKVRIKNG